MISHQDKGGSGQEEGLVAERTCVFACNLLSENKERDVNSTPVASRKGRVG